MYTFDSRVVEQKFLEAMRRAGCSPVDTNETIFHDGKIHRFRIQGDKSYDKSGAYCLFDENWPAGWFQNWRTGVFETWSLSRSDLDDNARSFFNDEHYKEARRLSEEHQKKAQAELLLKQQKAILDARQFWKETNTLATCKFPYLEIKDVGVWGGIKSGYMAGITPLMSRRSLSPSLTLTATYSPSSSFMRTVEKGSSLTLP